MVYHVCDGPLGLKHERLSLVNRGEWAYGSTFRVGNSVHLGSV